MSMVKRTLDEIELSVSENQDELNQMLADDAQYAEWSEAQHIQAVDEQNKIEPTIQTLAESAALHRCRLPPQALRVPAEGQDRAAHGPHLRLERGRSD